jgi:hypothetical protein
MENTRAPYFVALPFSWSAEDPSFDRFPVDKNCYIVASEYITGFSFENTDDAIPRSGCYATNALKAVSQGIHEANIVFPCDPEGELVITCKHVLMQRKLMQSHPYNNRQRPINGEGWVLWRVDVVTYCRELSCLSEHAFHCYCLMNGSINYYFH